MGFLNLVLEGGGGMGGKVSLSRIPAPSSRKSRNLLFLHPFLEFPFSFQNSKIKLTDSIVWFEKLKRDST